MAVRYFGTDGIRGRAGQFPMTADVALKVAQASAYAIRSKQNGDATNRVIIGKDTRLSGYMFEEAMAAGFVSMGMDVILLGPVPTPAIAMLTRSLRADIGVMISASHNPYEDNGIKLFGADGYKLDDALEAAVEANIETDLSDKQAAPADVGKATRLEDALGRYIEFIKQSFPKDQSLAGLKIVVDCAHGAAYKCAPQVLWELEADVISIGVSPDGRNINDGYGATATANLERAVLDEGADIGIALDGDADRLIMVDEKGRKIDGDQLMAVLTLDWKDKGKLKGPGLVATVMSNLGLERLLEQEDLQLHRTSVGDRHVVDYMRSHGFNLGGEQSGHMVLSDYATTGDGLLAALQILAILKEQGKPASQALNLFVPAPQILKNVKTGGGPVLNVPEVTEAIQKAESNLDGKGRLLVRPSGTEPLIRVMAEGDDEGLIDSVVSDLCEVIEKAAKTA